MSVAPNLLVKTSISEGTTLPNITKPSGKTITNRDNAGAITQKVETLNDTTTTCNYTYDNLGRLTQVEKDNTPTEEYTYDNNGNRATATVNNKTTSASYTLDDSLVVYGDNSYLYDEDGYLQTKTTPQGTTTYSYGTLGELKEVVTPTKTISYKHNANNQRVAKLINNQVVEKYLWANLTTLLAVYDANDNLVQRFEYADQRMPVAMTDGNGTKYYLHYDQVGTLRAVSDIGHNIIKEITYDTFGNILNDTNPSFKVPFGFAGGLYDQDTKLTRFGYRDYDAYTGKWTAKDPIGFDGGDSNLYGYVLGDPVGLVDPLGLYIDPRLKGCGVPRAMGGDGSILDVQALNNDAIIKPLLIAMGLEASIIKYGLNATLVAIMEIYGMNYNGNLSRFKPKPPKIELPCKKPKKGGEFCPL